MLPMSLGIWFLKKRGDHELVPNRFGLEPTSWIQDFNTPRQVGHKGGLPVFADGESARTAPFHSFQYTLRSFNKVPGRLGVTT